MIEQIPFFQGLDAEDLAKLEAISVVKKYKNYQADNNRESP